MRRITSRQAKSARAILKWNLPDIAAKTNIRPERINSFEKGLLQLHKWEMEEMIKAYQDAGIIFKVDLSVTYDRSKVKDDKQLIDPRLVASQGAVAGSGVGSIRIESDKDFAEDKRIIADSELEDDERKKQKQKEKVTKQPSEHHE